jgi:superfamily II DNA or RNA helicase
MLENLQQNAIVSGKLFPESVQIIATVPMGNSVKLYAKGLQSGRVYEPILTLDQIQELEITPDREPFDGDSLKFRLGVEALRWGLAYEYDPYFSLAVARVDPLPHQLEAVYEYFLKQPRIRFLLADDPGAGKTVMAGLLLKELKIRGLAKRTLIITPANLTFQWQREMKDKFREDFEVLRGDVLRANYGMNPWQDKDQVVTSISWVSRVSDAKDSLLRSHWDLIIVDEAHKMSAYSNDKKTLAYQLGEELAGRCDHLLLMTATPHKGDPKNFCLFLELLDRDVYGDIKSLDEAMRRHSAPFYLRRTKEALVTFPDPSSGEVKKLFTNRRVETISFQIDDEELDFYDELTRYVEDQSIKAAQDNSARGRALGFIMAMLQRRFASSIRAVCRSLERMKDKRERILADPDAHRQSQIDKKLPDDFDELPEEEQSKILGDLENVVASIDPHDLRDEIIQLTKLIKLAKELEKREIETKLVKLKEVIDREGIFQDPKMKLLIFTEHKDTLDYLVGKLRDWGLSVTQIHGGMKIGDRDTPKTRIYSEREFREDCQILVATEAAGEGINLQFCWLMINYDIPWNPVRLEQRMGRIHRYGQEKDCLIFNFVASNTREGRVLQKLFERIQAIEADLDPEHTGKVFNVIGNILPSNWLEKMLRDMYARNLSAQVITDRIVTEVDATNFRKIADSTLEGLAKRELDLSKLVGKTAEARENRLVPESVEDFFLKAAPLAGIHPKEVKKSTHQYQIGRTPRHLWSIGERIESQFGKLGREYKQIVFDKEALKEDPTLEWVTPGHPLFESVRHSVLEQVETDLRHGAIFYDVNRDEPALLDVFSSGITDGRGHTIRRKLFVVETGANGAMSISQPTIFLDLALAADGASAPPIDPPDKAIAEQYLLQQSLQPFLAQVSAERGKEVETISNHLEISLNTIIDRVQCQYGELLEQKESGSTEAGIDGRLKQIDDRLHELNSRLEIRQAEIEQERSCSISNIQHHGRAWVLPHPQRTSPEIAPMVSDAEIEKVAVQTAIEYEQARGWVVESVESQNRGFDLISRKPHPNDSQTAIDVRFIEVKGRSAVGMVALTSNEYKKAKEMKQDYWLYVVFDCGTTPNLHAIQDPVQLGWKAVVSIEHYQVDAKKILEVSP